MGLEYIAQPQVFLAPISAQQGIRGLIENYPLLTTFQSWASTTSNPTTSLYIPGYWTMLETPSLTGEVVPESFIVTVGGVTQAPNSYKIFNYPIRKIEFTSEVPENVLVNLTQLATHAPSSQRFSYLRADSALITNLTATTVVFVTAFTVLENLSAFTAQNIIADYLSAASIETDQLNASVILSADQDLYTLFLPLYGGHIVSNTTTPALRITQSGTGDILRLEDETGDTTPLVVNDSGRVGIGVTNPLQTVSLETTNTDGASLVRISNDTLPGSLILGKTRGTLITRSNVLQNDTIGQIRFQGFDTSGTLNDSAIIESVVSGTVGLSSIPSHLIFRTNAISFTTPTERVRITDSGNFGINTSIPNERLTVVGNVSATGNITASQLTTVNNIVVGGTLNVAGDVLISDKIVHDGDTNTSIRFPGTDIFTVETAGSERLRITASGLVGIGTNSPGERLTVSGNLSASGTIQSGGYNVPRKFTASITGAGTSFTVTHNLGTRDVVVSVYNNSTYDVVFTSVTHTTTDTVTISFLTAPGSTTYRVVVIG
jgi:hypothetical protein